MTSAKNQGTGERLPITLGVSHGVLLPSNILWLCVLVFSALSFCVLSSTPSPSSSLLLVNRFEEPSNYILTVCDHLKRTLKGKTPVVLYINGHMHLAGDSSRRRMDSCVGGIFATTPGMSPVIRYLLS